MAISFLNGLNGFHLLTCKPPSLREQDTRLIIDRFNNYKSQMFSSCKDQFGVPNDSGPEVGAIWDAIQQVSKETFVDHRFILAVIMQESSGCVRAPTSNYGVRNPGLMQDHNGQFSCNENGVRNPCPKDSIFGMIREGTAGTHDGDGLAQVINQAGDQNVKAFYRAARLYNSGSIARKCSPSISRELY